MDKNNHLYQVYLQILKEELIPAIGCTEPISIAYGAAKAKEILGEIPDRISIACSPNIIKNVKSVVVPNTNGQKGIKAAVIAGIIGGRPDKELEVISQVTDDEKEKMAEAMIKLPVHIEVTTGDSTFEIQLELTSANNQVKLNISKFHTNIVYIEKNGCILLNKEVKETGTKEIADRSLLNVEDIIDFANTVAFDDIKDFFETQVENNLAIAKEGLKHPYGANIGKIWLNSHENSVSNQAIAKAAAASDARMSGCELPVVINSGSGNQGITVSIPVIEFAKNNLVSDDLLYRSLVVSNLIAIHEKAGIGRLSAYCGAVSAGCAAACGISYLEGGTLEEISATLSNSLAISSGIICDGAKPSCAAKIATSISTGLMGLEMYRNEKQQFQSGDGIVGSDIEKTINNVSRLGKDGMRQTDSKIIEIMLENDK